MEWLILAIMAAVIIFAIQTTAVTTLPTIDEYREQYPQSVDRRGVPVCHKCNSGNIYLWWLLGPQAGYGPKKHICRNCGTALYRS
jgi:hypothetical protein